MSRVLLAEKPGQLTGGAVVKRARVVVRGIVQGVGFRPFIHRLAYEHTLNGWVLNSTDGVVIEVEGQDKQLNSFIAGITTKAPPLAIIERVETSFLPSIGYQSFTIESSQSDEPGFVLVSPDICTCDDCLREVFDPTNRRFHYPFTNCTNCGPRFTIIKDIPYDRPKTTMQAFPMCPSCEEEYHDPTNRRFHAQPNACPDCGPHVWLQTKPDSESSGGVSSIAEREKAITRAKELLRQGATLAIKGLGGFHLACDATNDAAVHELRERKHRVEKPFALMSITADAVSEYCYLSEQERQLLESPQRPIVLLRRKDNSDISPLVAPGNNHLGVMLPYTPLHYLLLAGEAEESHGGIVRRDRQMPIALVMTSGNMSEEPLAINNEEALEKLNPLADHFLLHDRDINIRCDDSVTRLFQGQETLIRRSRGYAPFPVRLRFAAPQETLGCGGELKNTFCLAKGHYAFLSQHIGDLQNIETLRSYEETIEHFQKLFRVQPTLIAHDMHPEYMSTQWAIDLAARLQGNCRLIPIQHHEAHIASCMAENEVYEPVIGVAFDGTGYGRDGAIWGGEFFIGDYGAFQRAAHLEYVPMPGGEAAIRRPWRMALSYVHKARGKAGLAGDLPNLNKVNKNEVVLAVRQMQRGLNSPLTSSCGRLFDAVSALLGIRGVVNYEGQAAIEMEALADTTIQDSYAWQYEVSKNKTIILRASSIIDSLISDIESGVETATIAARFHNSIAEMIATTCGMLSARTGLKKVALSGGVFQNTLLLTRTLEQLKARELQPYIHHLTPTNDGGISLGQVMIANAQQQNGGN